jgi:DNA (cytosine-5)-methyltransferase 1
VKFISLFAGIGGLDLGLERAGMECVAQVEIDEFCQKILTKHWADVPKYKDVRDVGKHNLPTAELICGGFPCQDVSLAGRRLGLEGKRSTLWSEFYRIVCEVQPRWVVIENVAGLLSSDDGEFFKRILWDFSKIGFNAEWFNLFASDFSAPHPRERIFVVAYPASARLERIHWKESWEKSARFAKGSMGDGGIAYWEGWGLEPAVVRMGYGIPSRMDRLKSLGSAVVPQVAEFVGRQIMEAETRLTQRPPDAGYAPRLNHLSTPEVFPAEGELSTPAPRR